ncbi:natural killer cells antigen CD94-like [Pelmatolapia mariae]|uniref:natural killer cells antigen CD94-like n=1 Tax=Pelmatolapia mariae TaxID=158779 RepID=UPI002FE65644
MSADSQTAADFRVKYSRRIDSDGREQEHSEVQMLDDEEQHPDVGLQAAVELNTQKKISAVKRRCFRAFEVNLGLLYLLILAGITTRCILVTLEKQQLQEEVKELKDKMEEKCPDRWTRFGCSCYFKSTERKTWSESRRDCQDKGADLVMINSKEEQIFVNKLGGESWIGLRPRYISEWNYEWEWVDGSALTQTFWAAGWSHRNGWYYAACCDNNGRWTEYYSGFKTFICEK